MIQDIEQIRARLAGLGDKERAEKSRSYLKSEYEFYGIRVPELRKIAKEYKNIDFTSALNLFDELWGSGNHEEMSLALFILGAYIRKYPDEIWKFLVERLEKAKSWDHVDELSAHILGEILEKNYSYSSEIKKLAEDKNPWFRRTAVVSCYKMIKQGKLDLAFLLAEKLIYDENIYVQKASGWMLREAGKQNRLAVRDFILSHLDMKASAFSYATEKMKELREIRKSREKEIN